MIAGIVCEYNPFHNGHLYHIEKTKQVGADYIVCVMSGNFVQRGECAILPKHKRAEAAIRGGADLVIDLPVPWSMGSAESFARGSISLLSQLGIDLLSFGSESEDKALLRLCADAADDERVIMKVKSLMSEGLSYPSALSQSVGEVFGEKARQILSSPNSTLAVEYIKQLKIYSPKCDMLPVKRAAVEHDSTEAADGFASASKIRELIGKNDVSPFVSPFVSEIISDSVSSGFIHRAENGERAILSSLREMKKEEYSLYVTDESGLSDRIYNAVRTADSLEELYMASKSKNYTHSRIRREVMNLYLKIPKEYCRKTPPYIKVLAANERGLSLLKNAELPVVTKHSEAIFTDDFSKRIYDLQCSSTDKFALMSEKIGPCGMEQSNSVAIIK